MRFLLGSALVALALAAPVQAKDKTLESVSCSGLYGPDTTRADLVAAFGADNVVDRELNGPEGMTYNATLVFPDDDNRRMEFSFWDEEAGEGLSYVELAKSQTGPLGIHIGMTIAELTELNDEPLYLNGFGWDYGGRGSARTGALSDAEQPCFISFGLTYDEAKTAELGNKVDPIFGDIELKSDMELLTRAGVTVESIMLGYPYPDDLPPPEY